MLALDAFHNNYAWINIFISKNRRVKNIKRGARYSEMLGLVENWTTIIWSWFIGPCANGFATWWLDLFGYSNFLIGVRSLWGLISKISIVSRYLGIWWGMVLYRLLSSLVLILCAFGRDMKIDAYMLSSMS